LLPAASNGLLYQLDASSQLEHWNISGTQLYSDVADDFINPPQPGMAEQKIKKAK
jgi:hypothetical protein